MNEFTHSLSIDIGGTFTDFSLLNIETGELSIHKILTDPENPAKALVRGVNEVLETVGITLSAIQVIVHSTTLATNAIIERKGAKVALLTTKGFRDVLEMGREQIYDMHDLHARYPEPIVPRSLRISVTERVDRDGRVVLPIDVKGALVQIEDLLDQGVEAVAISLLHSYNNSENEQLLKELINDNHPALPLSLSSEVAPVINEYERTSTTVADAYIKPSVSEYIRSIENDLSEKGYDRRLLVMHSAGGVMDASSARERPIRMLESGPAAGALAAGFYSELLGEPDLISLDMGGTTAKTCVIEGGNPSQSNSIEVARVHRYKVGSGLPILIPVLDLIEIGSGGGSIAWLDQLGLLRVGPESSGANPGPACYGMGGKQPTVTDANLALGYLNPNYFLGGRMTLDIDAANQAITSLGLEMGMTMVEAARGIYDVVTESMAAAARIHIIGRNKDPRNYAIVAFGGAGPAHACEVARILGVKRVVIPLGAGVTSALGCLAAPLSFENVRSLPSLLAKSDWSTVNQLYTEMESWGKDMLSNAGIPLDKIEFHRTADMRLVGQIHEIKVPIPNNILAESDVNGIEAEFHKIYQQLYSRKNLSIPIEVQNWRLLISSPKPTLNLQEQTIATSYDPNAALKGSRPAYFPNSGGFVDCPVYDRYKLVAGTQIIGPSIIEEQESTTVIRPSDSASIDKWLNLSIQIKP